MAHSIIVKKNNGQEGFHKVSCKRLSSLSNFKCKTLLHNSGFHHLQNRSLGTHLILLLINMIQNHKSLPILECLMEIIIMIITKSNFDVSN